MDRVNKEASVSRLHPLFSFVLLRKFTKSSGVSWRPPPVCEYGRLVTVVSEHKPHVFMPRLLERLKFFVVFEESFLQIISCTSFW